MIYEDTGCWQSNLCRTFEETLSLFYLTKQVVRHSLRKKIEKTRRKAGFLRLIELMEAKVSVFSEEILKAEDHYAEVKAGKKNYIRILTEATATHDVLKALSDCKKRSFTSALIPPCHQHTRRKRKHCRKCTTSATRWRQLSRISRR